MKKYILIFVQLSSGKTEKVILNVSNLVYTYQSLKVWKFYRNFPAKSVILPLSYGLLLLF